jgi:hypothetical protein
MTYSQYANHRKSRGLSGQTKQAVAEAVKAGRVLRLADGSIDAEKADTQWQARTDPGKQRSVNRRSPPKRNPARGEEAKTDAETGGVGAAVAEDPFHEGRVSALAQITAVDEVLRFAESLLRLGCSAEVACAAAQLFSLRSSAVLHDVTCDDMSEFEDPTPDRWRRTLGDLDLDEADRLCDLVAGD